MRTINKIVSAGIIIFLSYSFTSRDRKKKNNIYKTENSSALAVLGHITNTSFDFKQAGYRLYRGNTFVEFGTTNRFGRIEAMLMPNCQYMLVLTAPGFFPKKIFFNTMVPEDFTGTHNFDFQVELISNDIVNGIDVCTLDVPYAMVFFNSETGEFDYDKNYTEKIMIAENEIISRMEFAQSE